MYEFATAEEQVYFKFSQTSSDNHFQQYKEGKTILEKALIFERDGFVDENLDSVQEQRQQNPNFASFVQRARGAPQFGFGQMISDDE